MSFITSLTPSRSIASLPPELIEIIFTYISFFPHALLARVSPVCKRWRNIALRVLMRESEDAMVPLSKEEYLFRVKLAILVQSPLQRQFPRLSQPYPLAPSMTRLVLRFHQLNPISPVCDGHCFSSYSFPKLTQLAVPFRPCSCCLRIIVANPSIRSLAFCIGCDTNAFDPLEKLHLPLLEVLMIVLTVTFSASSKTHFAAFLATHATQLKELQLAGVNMLPPVSFPLLQRLVLPLPSVTTNEAALHLLQAAPNLSATELTLRLDAFATVEVLQRGVVALSSLTLHVNNEEQVLAFSECLHACKNLCSLRIITASLVSNLRELWLPIASRLTHLSPIRSMKHFALLPRLQSTSIQLDLTRLIIASNFPPLDLPNLTSLAVDLKPQQHLLQLLQYFEKACPNLRRMHVNVESFCLDRNVLGALAKIAALQNTLPYLQTLSIYPFSMDYYDSANAWAAKQVWKRLRIVDVIPE